MKNWDALFHEELFPATDSVASWAEWHANVLYPEVDELKFEALLDQRFAWWSRHGLGAALPDFRVPDVHFQRRDGDVEISWTDAEWRDLRPGVQLSVQPGVWSVPVECVCGAVEEWCWAVLEQLRAKVRVDHLIDRLREIRSDARTSLGRCVGIGCSQEGPRVVV